MPEMNADRRVPTAADFSVEDMNLDAIFNVPFVFWICPKGCHGQVEWTTLEGGAMQARCEACGEQSPPRPTNPEPLPWPEEGR